MIDSNLIQMERENESRKAIPTDWLETATIEGVEYRIDMSFRIWDMSAEKVIFRETGIGEINIRNVIDGSETWIDGSPFTFSDFLTECLGVTENFD